MKKKKEIKICKEEIKMKKVIVEENTDILLFDCSTKLAKDLTTEDILIGRDGLTKASKIIKTKEKLYKINVRNGNSIICGKNNFVILDKICKRRNNISDAKIIVGNPVENSFLFCSVNNMENNFEISKVKAWILGLAASNIRFESRHKKISSITIFCKKDIDDLIKKEFPCASVIRSSGNKNLISLSGENIIEFFKYHIGGNGREKRLSLDLIWMNKELQEEFIDGFISNKYDKDGLVISCLNSKNLSEAIKFILTRLQIPYTTRFNEDYYKICFNKVPIRNKYRKFNNGILFKVKDVEYLGIKDCIEIYSNEIIVNGYLIDNIIEKKYIKYETKCKECNKKLYLQQNICSNCSKEKLNKLSWRYEKFCKECGKDISNSFSIRKFCSETCRRKNYNPEQYKNNGENLKGYVNKGFLSYPQKFIYDIIRKIDINTTYNDRTIIRNPNSNYPLELDIWCPNKKIAIEFDGTGHFNKKKNTCLEYRQKLDEIKNQECLKNDIKLLRISYKDPWKDRDWILKNFWELLNGNK